MKNFPPELIYGLIFAAIVLFQFMMKRMGQQQPQESAPDEDLLEIPEEVTQTAPVFSVPNLAVGHFGRTEAAKAAPPLARRRFSRRSLMGTRREVQNAVVIASILGPCRAFEPHDVR